MTSNGDRDGVETPTSSAADPGVPAARGVPAPWRRRRVLAAVGLGAALAATGGVAFAAGGPSSSPSASPGTGTDEHGGMRPDADGPGGMHGFHRHGGPGPGGFGGLGRVLHGTVTIDPPGSTGTLLVDIQTGTVSSRTASSLVLRSADGYTHTYLLTSSTSVDHGRATTSAVSSGDQVMVVADHATGAVRLVEDRALVHPRMPRPLTSSPSASPSASASGAST